MGEIFGVKPWELIDYLPSEIAAMEQLVAARRVDLG